MEAELLITLAGGLVHSQRDKLHLSTYRKFHKDELSI